MKYENIREGIFFARPNRFIAEVAVDGKTEKVHVKNTGRLGELLVPGRKVYLTDHITSMGNRKLRYSLISIEHAGCIVNIDSQVPNKVIEESLKNKKLLLPEMDELTIIRPETAYGDSRFDFFVQDIGGRTGFIEVKGCTLNLNGTALFPDAKTERGVKHLNHLVNAHKNGYFAYIVFLIARNDANNFQANRKRDPKFAQALMEAYANGVHVLCYDSIISENEISIGKAVRISGLS